MSDKPELVIPGHVRVHVATGVTVTNPIYTDTTANWNAQKDLVGKKGCFYVYSDYAEADGSPVPGVKLGDGNSFLIDLPFIGGNTAVAASTVVTKNEKEFWNNKVTAFQSSGDPETLVLTNMSEADYKENN